jgi:2-polyprenyl-3-methyl-5-hydroxy-6-metoxy-1,4-benzoquinol methylase
MTMVKNRERLSLAVGERICFALSAQLHCRQNAIVTRYVSQNCDYDAQQRERREEAQRYLRYFEKTVPFEGKTVLDFACGSGGIAHAIATIARPREVIGVDCSAAHIERGKADWPEISLRCAPKNQTLLPSSSIDIAYSVDSFEHFEQPDAVLEELYRVVKPNGYILIQFIPWWGIEGAHLTGVIPIPWCHVLFSPRTLHRTASRIVRSEFYRPLAWDFNAAGGRRYDIYDGQDDFDPTYLNRITIGRFKQYLSRFTEDGRLAVVNWELQGFSGTVYWWARYFRWLAHVPGLREFANRGVYCALRKCR